MGILSEEELPSISPSFLSRVQVVFSSKSKFFFEVKIHFKTLFIIVYYDLYGMYKT